MAKTGRFQHSPEVTTPITSVGTSYSTSKVHAIDMRPQVTLGADPSWKGFLESLVFNVSSIAGGATKITMKLCADAAGDIIVVGDVEETITLGTTTPTSGGGQIFFDSFAYHNTQGLDAVYIFYKCDAGTVTVDRSQLNWTE